MARRSGAIVDDILGFSYEKKYHPPYVHSLVNVRIHQTSKRNVWYVYDVRKSLPVMLSPVYRIRYSGDSYKLIDIVTKEVVFSATTIASIAKFADANLPPRINGDRNDERSTATDETN